MTTMNKHKKRLLHVTNTEKQFFYSFKRSKHMALSWRQMIH